MTVPEPADAWANLHLEVQGLDCRIPNVEHLILYYKARGWAVVPPAAAGEAEKAWPKSTDGTGFVTWYHPGSGLSGRFPEGGAQAAIDGGWIHPDEIAADAPSPVEGTVAEVLARVNGDPALAGAAHTAELATPKPRTSLIEALEAILHPATPDAPATT